MHVDSYKLYFEYQSHKCNGIHLILIWYLQMACLQIFIKTNDSAFCRSPIVIIDKVEYRVRCTQGAYQYSAMIQT